MHKAEAQQKHTQNQSAQRRGRGGALDSPQSEQIAQLEAMAEASPQAGKLAQLAAMTSDSSVAAVKRRMIGHIHNSPLMAAQRKLVEDVVNSPLQRITVGYVPTNPAAFRGTTNIAYDHTGAPGPNKAFNNAQRPNIYANNLAQGGGAAPVVAGVNHAREDIAPGAALMNRDAVSDIEPEIDHIVPRANGGVNDNDNARVLSKTNNTNGVPARPTDAEKSLRIYEDATISFMNDETIYHDGDLLNQGDVLSLCDYADVNPGNVRDIPNADLATIGVKPKGETNKGVTVT